MTAPINPLERDELGLLKAFKYPRRNDGSIDWRACLLPEHLYVNPEFETELKTRFNVKSRWDVDVTKCEDKQLLVNQAGWNYLCFLRGLKAITPGQPVVLPGEVHMSVTVEFLPNFENPYGLIRGDSASASIYTEKPKFQLHLASMAFNKAFARAVRLALRVPIYGQDEFADANASATFVEQVTKGNNPFKPAASIESQSAQVNKPTPVGILEKLCTENKISFEALKKRAIEVRGELGYVAAEARGDKPNVSFDPANWTGFNEDSIMVNDALILIGKIREAVGKKTAAKKA